MGRVVDRRRLPSALKPNYRVSKRGKDASGLESAHALSTFPPDDD
jgi:hypothetical protein